MSPLFFNCLWHCSAQPTAAMLMRPLKMAGSASSGHKMQSLLIQHFNCWPSLPKWIQLFHLCRRAAVPRERSNIILADKLGFKTNGKWCEVVCLVKTEAYFSGSRVSDGDWERQIFPSLPSLPLRIIFSSLQRLEKVICRENSSHLPYLRSLLSSSLCSLIDPLAPTSLSSPLSSLQ